MATKQSLERRKQLTNLIEERILEGQESNTPVTLGTLYWISLKYLGVHKYDVDHVINILIGARLVECKGKGNDTTFVPDESLIVARRKEIQLTRKAEIRREADSVLRGSVAK